MKAELIARVGMCLSYADGDVDPSEVACLMIAMSDLGISGTDAEAAIDAAASELEEGADPNEMLASAIAKVPAKQRPGLFELCAHVLMGDGRVTDSEVQRLAAVRTLLGIDEALSLKVVASAAADAAARDEGLHVE